MTNPNKDILTSRILFYCYLVGMLFFAICGVFSFAKEEYTLSLMFKFAFLIMGFFLIMSFVGLCYEYNKKETLQNTYIVKKKRRKVLD